MSVADEVYSGNASCATNI